MCPTRAPEQLDLAAGLQAKADGLARVEGTHPEFIPAMRAVAKAISQRRGWVHIDDLRIEASVRGRAPRSPNAWGSIFAGKGWVKVGARKSEWKTNHGHVSPCWKWMGL
jgi:hypothetical protein